MSLRWLVAVRAFENPQFYMNKNTRVRVATLNCRDLPKVSQPQVCQSFIPYIRCQELDIIAVRESHAESDTIQQSLDILFQTKSSFWSHHCGIISLNPAISLSPVLSSGDGRTLIAEITHDQSVFAPVTIVNVYTASRSVERPGFFDTLLQLWQSSLVTPVCGTLVLGDFNSHFRSTVRQPPLNWRSFTAQHLQDCMTPVDAEPLPTFRRGTHSILDNWLHLRQLRRNTISHRRHDPVHKSIMDRSRALDSWVLFPGPS